MKNVILLIGAFAILAVVGLLLTSTETKAALRDNVFGNYVFSTFSTTTGQVVVGTSSTQMLATTTLKNRSYAEVFNTGQVAIYCDINGRAAAVRDIPVAASSSIKFTVDNPYQGAINCISSTSATTTAFVLETGY